MDNTIVNNKIVTSPLHVRDSLEDKSMFAQSKKAFLFPSETWYTWTLGAYWFVMKDTSVFLIPTQT